VRRIPILTLVALAVLAMGGAAVAATLTPRNAVSYDLMTNSTEVLAGTNCGATATFSKTLPAGSTGIKLVKPVVGDRDGAGNGTTVTAATVTGTVISFTVVANGPNICDPALTGYPPGADVPWKATYDVRAEYQRLIPTTIRIYFESYVFGAKWKDRPKTIQDSRAGTPRNVRQRYTGIKWSSFGGKKAVGKGKLRQDYCRRGDNCPQNGKRVRLVASKPRFCKDSGKFEYLKLDVYIGKMNWFSNRIECSR